MSAMQQLLAHRGRRPCLPGRASRSNSSSSWQPHPARPGHDRRHQGQMCNRLSVAVSADLVLASTAEQAVLNAVPYVSSSAPKLKSRSMVGSPIDGLWCAASSALLRLELLAAAVVDRHDRAGPAILSALAGAAAGMGVDALTLLQHGLPPYFQDLLLAAFGAWDTTLWAIVLTAAALPITAWALRCWWVANIQLLSSTGGAVQQLLQRVQQQQGQEQTPAQQQQGAGSWMAGLIAIVRGLCLSTVVSSVTRCMSSTSLAGTALAAAAAATATAVAAAPLLLPLAASGSSGKDARTAAPLAAHLLAAEAAWVVAMVGVAPLANLAAAVGIAYCLFTLHKQVVAPRLLRLMVAAGDEVEAHVSLKLAGTTVAFDSTRTEEPLRLLAQKRSPEQVQDWQQVGSDEFWHQVASQQQPAAGPAGDSAAAAAATADRAAPSSSNSVAAGGLRDLSHELRGWLATPAARWEALLPFVADAACGMFLGETRTLQVFNPRAVGYFNPSFSWWQPTADVVEKFNGEMPGVGDVFWYPVADGAYLPTRVAALGERYVELDANYGVVDTQLQLEVQLVRVHKK